MRRAAWLQDRRMEKFSDVLRRWERGGLSMMEAGELLGMSERQFRRYRDRYEEDGAGWAGRRSARQGFAEAGSGGGRSADARALSVCIPRLEREAFSRAPGARSQVPMGLHVREDAVAQGGSCRACQEAWHAPSQARAQAVRGHDAAPGRLASGVALRPAGTRSDRHDGRCDEHDLLGLPDRGRRHRLDVPGIAGGFCWARSAVEPLYRSRQPLFSHLEGRREGRQGPAHTSRPRTRSAGNRAHSRPIRPRPGGARNACSGRFRIA